MQSLGYSEIETMENLDNKYDSKKQKKNKTFKKRMQPSKEKMTGKNVENFLNLMKDFGNNDSTDGSGLADFNPPPKPLITKQPDDIIENDNIANNSVADNSISDNDFNNLDDYAANEKYYNQYIPYYTESQNQPKILDNKDKLFEKLNYMIHLLEEEKDSKTNNITEELVLYMFLGVFVIFIVDSFARVSKYKR